MTGPLWERFVQARAKVKELGYVKGRRKSVKRDAFWAGFRARCMGRKMPVGLSQAERGAWKRGYGVPTKGADGG